MVTAYFTVSYKQFKYIFTISIILIVLKIMKPSDKQIMRNNRKVGQTYYKISNSQNTLQKMNTFIT